MFRHILVPLDFTRKNARALALASALAKDARSKITLLHVIERIERIPPEELEDFYGRLERRATARMQAIAARLGRKHRHVRGEIVLGNRLREIVRYAARHGVDLLALSSHAIGPRGGRHESSMSHDVALVAPCPVLLVRDTRPARAAPRKGRVASRP